MQLKINIEEIDDNKPLLNKPQYRECVPFGSTTSNLVSAFARDKDVLPEHRTLKYELDGSGPFSVDEAGTITGGDVSSYSLGHVFKLSLRASGKLDTYCNSFIYYEN